VTSRVESGGIGMLFVSSIKMKIAGNRGVILLFPKMGINKGQKRVFMYLRRCMILCTCHVHP
jgi:hypothetical protein